MRTRRGFSRLLLFWINLVLDFSPSASDPLMYYSDRYNIRSHDLDTGSNSILLPSAFTNAMAMDFHYANEKLYVSDVVTKKLYSVDLSISSPEAEMLLDVGLDVAEGLAVDWINNNLYWTDKGNCTSVSTFLVCPPWWSAYLCAIQKEFFSSKIIMV